MKKYGIIYILLVLNIFLGYAQIIKRPIQNKIVVLTFDDATASHYSVVAPLLKKYEFGATFFVCEFQPNFNDSSKYMNWQQIRELDRMGFEIANHTKTHVNISKLTNEEFLSQIEYIENKCDSLHIIKPVSFAYPGYNLNEQSIKVLQAKGYRFARAGGGRAYNPKNDHPLLIPSWAMNSKNKPEIMNAFQEATNGKIVVITIHGVPDIEHPWVNTSPELFSEYLQYLHENHFKVIALRDLEKYINVKRALKSITPDFSKKLNN